MPQITSTARGASLESNTPLRFARKRFVPALIFPDEVARMERLEAFRRLVGRTHHVACRLHGSLYPSPLQCSNLTGGEARRLSIENEPC